MRNTLLLLILLLVGFAALCSAQDEATLKAHEQARAAAVISLLSSGAVQEGEDGMLHSAGALDPQAAQTVESENQDRRAIFALISQKSRVPVEEVARMYANRVPHSMPMTSAGVGACKLVPAKNVDVARLLQYLKQGVNYAGQKRFDAALAEFRSALAIDKNFLGLNGDIGSAQMEMKNYQDAETSLKAELKLVDCLSGLTNAQLSRFGYFIEVDEADPAKRKQLQAERLQAQVAKEKAATEYNLACVYSLQKQKDQSITALRTAIDSGFSDRKVLSAEPALAYVRQSSEYRDLVNRLK